MEKNEGTLDRALRVTAGLALIGLSISNLISPWGYLGVVPLLTGALGWCPIYTLLRIKTCPVKRG